MGDFDLFSIRLRELRKQKKMTQKKFAELVGTTSVTISAYENGTKKPSLDIALNIATKCNISLDWLCGLSEQKEFKLEVNTYGDIFSLLFKIEETGLNVYPDCKTEFDLSNKCYTVPFISFSCNKYIEKFFDDWKKLSELHKDESINNDLYNRWIESQIKEYDFPINTLEDQKEFIPPF
ncbi:helix-turn-helix transcriptional regulator [Vallitalea sp.]|jgi:transcriptional regulator with XRE-family HTH domain|uniref:helix-turn-helix transcriptional regulator n=1 Tax=Vallitalea sp. TaxID=1882829 RepID=UPI0025D97346|nr:helix-turn-helix transcriptional regulator [Vallitalea sp.]MCT4687965.1 helix-turn-helix domain-containing protein [Vallitalea sp.]